MQGHCVSGTTHLGEQGSQKIRTGTHRFGTSRHPSVPIPTYLRWSQVMRWRPAPAVQPGPRRCRPPSARPPTNRWFGCKGFASTMFHFEAKLGETTSVSQVFRLHRQTEICETSHASLCFALIVSSWFETKQSVSLFCVVSLCNLFCFASFRIFLLLRFKAKQSETNPLLHVEAKQITLQFRFVSLRSETPGALKKWFKNNI